MSQPTVVRPTQGEVDLALELADEQDPAAAFFSGNGFVQILADEVRAQTGVITQLRDALEKIIALSDRKHDAWDQAKRILATSRGETKTP